MQNINQEKLFFDYDQIDYHNTNIAESKVMDFYKTKAKSEIDSIKKWVIIGSIPRTINDTLFLSKLDEISFFHNNIDTAKFSKINKIFVEKQTNENIALSCEPVYRDILIFRNKSRIVGIAKICFGCMQYQIIGTTANTENFGQDGDFGRLKELLPK